MSVVLAASLRASGEALTSVLHGHEGFALVSITAQLARQLNQAVARNPLPNDPHHAIVYGKKTDGARKRMSKECLCVLDPVL
jgi:hypothetical protein